MHKIIISVLLSSFVMTPAAHSKAVAICIAKHKNDKNATYDREYFIRSGGNVNTNGFMAKDAAMKDLKVKHASDTLTPYCRHSGRKFMDGGYYVILNNTKRNYSNGGQYNKWALGFGRNKGEAIIDAMAELKRRDSSWSEKENGFTITDSQPF